MKRPSKYHLNISIDKLTNSIFNTISGDSFPTDVHPVSKADLKGVSKKNGWLFSWTTELKYSDRQVFKLTTRDNPNIIQGLSSVSDYGDHFYLHLVESAVNLFQDKTWTALSAHDPRLFNYVPRLTRLRFLGLLWWGVLALNFIRSNELPPCTKLSARHGTPAIVNPLLCVGATAATNFWYGISQTCCPFFIGFLFF